MDHTGGRLCYRTEKVAQIAMACCILHNFCRRKGIQEPTRRNDDDASETFVNLGMHAVRDAETETIDNIAKQQRASIVLNL